MRPRFMLLRVLLLTLPLLASCSEKREPNHTVEVYYAVVLNDQTQPDGPVIRGVNIELPAQSTEALSYAVHSLKTSPEDPSLRSALPEDTEILDVYTEDGCAVILLSGAWESVSGLHQTIAEYCMLNTVLSFEGITSMRWETPAGTASPGRVGAVLRQDSFIGTPLELVSARQTITLYFADTAHHTLLAESRSVVMRESESTEWYRHVVDGLIAGPVNSGAQAVIPEGTRLLSVTAESGRVCTVNFSRELVTAAAGTPGTARMTLLALVNSLTELPGVSFVKIRVEGEDVPDYFGFDISAPLERESSALRAGLAGEVSFAAYYPAPDGLSYLPALRWMPPDIDGKGEALCRLTAYLSSPPPLGLPDGGLSLLKLASFSYAEGGYAVTFAEETADLLHSGALRPQTLLAVALTLARDTGAQVWLYSGTENLAPRLTGQEGAVEIDDLPLAE